MPKKKKERTDWAITRGQASRWQKEQRQRRIITISVSVVIAVVLILLSVVVIDSLIDDEDNPTVLIVNDESVKMDEFVTMLRLYNIANQDASQQTSYAGNVLRSVENALIVRQLAPTLGLSVTDSEIDAEIDDIFAPPDDVSQTDPTYISYDAYLKQLKRRGVSEKYVRQDIENVLLSEKIQDFIGERDVSPEAAQAHLQGILIDVASSIQETAALQNTEEGEDVDPAPVFKTDEDPSKIREAILARLSGGDEFAALAEEYSGDIGSMREGGDLGWLPSDLVSLMYGEEFNASVDALDLGTLSPPIAASASGSNTRYWLVEVLEREESRLLDEDNLSILQSQAANEWFTEQRDAFTIEDLLNPDLRDLAIQKALE